jgi:hypothetical protein
VDGVVSQLEGRRTNYTLASYDEGWAGARANDYGQTESEACRRSSAVACWHAAETVQHESSCG